MIQYLSETKIITMTTPTTPKTLKGTRTEQYLAKSYIAESTAVTRYNYYAQSAQKENYFQVANVFAETASNELHHGKIFLKYLTEGTVEAEGPVGVDPGELTPTVDNLGIAAEEELNEGVKLYQQAADVAEEEGFIDIAARFRAIAAVENHHRDRFLKLQKRIQDGTMWKRDKPIKWQCLVCGYIFEGTEPPEVCPACLHPYQHYMPAEENF